MIAVEVALHRVLAGLSPTCGEMVALPQSLGRVLAQDCAARVAHPPLDVAAMDGYALRAADAPRPLRVVGESAAGRPFAATLSPGQAVRVFTGAALPDGADCVAMQEDCRRDGALVSVDSPPREGQFIRRAGMDFQAGAVLLTAGTPLGPRQIALAAAMNLPWLPVRRRPRVAILSTGDEIVLPGDSLGTAQLPASNGPGLAALVNAHGGEAVYLGIAADQPQSLDSLLAAARGCDMLVTTGGTSAGDYDLVQTALRDHGLNLDFWKVAMRPGKPLMFGHLDRLPVLGLPGNPVAALICGLVFLRPMLRVLLGLPPHLPLQHVPLTQAMPATDARQDYVRARLSADPSGRLRVTPLGRQDAAMLAGLAAADCLVVRPPHAGAAAPGDLVAVLPLE